jgi:hypothetical protein
MNKVDISSKKEEKKSPLLTREGARGWGKKPLTIT